MAYSQKIDNQRMITTKTCITLAEEKLNEEVVTKIKSNHALLCNDSNRTNIYVISLSSSLDMDQLMLTMKSLFHI